MAPWMTHPPRRVLVVREEHPSALRVAHHSAATLRVGVEEPADALAVGITTTNRACVYEAAAVLGEGSSSWWHGDVMMCIGRRRRTSAWGCTARRRRRSWGRGRSRLGRRQRLLHGHPARPLFPWLHQIQIDSPHLP
jgi:hypothetical protein